MRRPAIAAFGTLSALLVFSSGCASTTSEDVAATEAAVASGSVLLYGDENCRDGYSFAAVGPGSNCDALPNQYTYSVKIADRCIDVSNDYAPAVCARFKGGTTLLYSDEACREGYAFAAVGPGTNCSVLPNQYTYSVQIDGRCVDVSNDYAPSVCQAFKGSTLLYMDEACREGYAFASIGADTDCSTLPNRYTYSVRIGDQCMDVSNDYAPSVCKAFKGSTLLYSDEGCREGYAFAAVGPGTNCSALPNRYTYSVRINGRCIDVSNDYAPNVCTKFRGSNLLYADEGCREGYAFAAVGADTDCGTLPNQYTYSVRIGDRCIDVSNDYAPRICGSFRGSTLLYQDEACREGYAFAAVGPGTDCSALPNQYTYSVRIDGSCVDVSNDYAPRICEQYRGGP